ncbi:glycosyltransferase family 4 protein [Hufsiella ginkgonis]|uniref:Glycosyltransferase n=1 Tax=Hufsiella ginkgonis TaxID=2695274 RepID=A0A7K1Y2Z1_9SPHI|nr:glycosyltransferase family 1 protein [Hufsiella ginkgonis]MXV17389.1 glycosyltransferase [Hufsiella ginkgonis]
MNKRIVLDGRMIVHSGIGRYIREIILTLASTNAAVTILGRPDDFDQYKDNKNITIVKFDHPIYSVKEQLAFLSAPSCDLFISPHYNVPLFLPQAKRQMTFIPDVNHLVFINEFSLPKRLYAKFFFSRAVNKSDVIFTISDFSKAEIVKYTGCNPDIIHVAKLDIDKEHFSRIDHELETAGDPAASGVSYEELEYILYVGNIKPHKNLKRCIAAFNQLAESFPKLKFVIVGRKENFITGDSELISMLEENDGFDGRISMTGKISDVTLAHIYKYAKCLLFASLYEGFGLPPLEAMFFNCPVISSREGSLPEVCGDAALYCDAYDAGDISEKIALLLTSNSLRAELTAKGNERLGEFSWNKFRNQVAVKINDVLND